MVTKTLDAQQYTDLSADHRIAQSADGKRVQVDHQTQDQQWSLSALQSDIGENRYLYCTVGYHNLMPMADIQGLIDKLENHLQANGTTELSGGEVQSLQITPLWASEGSGMDQMYHIEALGVLPDPDFVAQFQIYSYGFSAGAFGVFPLDDLDR